MTPANADVESRHPVNAAMHTRLRAFIPCLLSDFRNAWCRAESRRCAIPATTSRAQPLAIKLYPLGRASVKNRAIAERARNVNSLRRLVGAPTVEGQRWLLGRE